MELSRAEIACAQKLRHRSKTIARAAGALEMRKRPGTRLYVYQCSVCNDWHLTKRPQESASSAVGFEGKARRPAKPPKRRDRRPTDDLTGE